jgi:site-specific DNA recombinase
MLRTVIYLRKSRADEELEKKLGEGETLAKHRKALMKYAKDTGLNIVKIYEELVSGEELFFRHAMLQLLEEVGRGLYDAVLVMDIQRLGRGDMEEQGIILKTLKKARAKIITPDKIYDLSNEFDEEYSEFEAFMSRKEYRMITRRMQGGRVRSIQEGNYIATRPPYGYAIEDLGKKGRTLVPHPDQADVVRMIFKWYVNENMGCGKIANELNRLGIKSYTNGIWERTSMSHLLKNPVYIGKVVWKQKCIRKSKTAGKVKDTYTRPKEEWIIADGKHTGLIDIEIYSRAQELLKGRYHIPYQIENGVVNPLASLMVCGICGSKMKRRPYGDREAHLICENKCGIKSNKFNSVENTVLEHLKLYINDLELKSKSDGADELDIAIKTLTGNIASLENEIETLKKQKIKLHDLLEQGVYTVDTFMERSRIIVDKIEAVENSIIINKKALKSKIENNRTIYEFLDEVKYVYDMYYKTDDVGKKNVLLKTVLNKIEYYKEKSWESDKFKIKLYPRHFDLTAF